MWEFPIGKCIFLVFHIIFVFGRWLWVCLLTCKQSLQAHVNQAASSAITGMGWKDRWTSSLMPRDGPDLSTLIDPETPSTLVSSALFFFFLTSQNTGGSGKLKWSKYISIYFSGTCHSPSAFIPWQSPPTAWLHCSGGGRGEGAFSLGHSWLLLFSLPPYP